MDYDFDLSEYSNYNKKNNVILKPGFILINRYILKQKLKNNFWLCFDLRYGNYVSIKIKNISFGYIDNENLEINFLKKIFKKNFDEDWVQSLKKYYAKNPFILSQINFEEHTNIVQMLNSFIYKEDNNEDIYLCNVYEIMGISLQNFFNKYNKKINSNKNKGIPLPYVKIIAKEILVGLDFIHRFGEIIHNNLNMDNILIGLTKEELEIIQETGYIYIEEEKNDNDTFDNDLIMDLDNNSRQMKKQSEQRIIKRQEKQMEKMGLSPKDKNKIMNKNNNIFNIDEIYIALNNDYDNIKDGYDIDELITRPRIASVPKKNNQKNKYDFDINDYRNEIQSYINEKNKIKNDYNYRKIKFIKNNLLEKFKDTKNRIDILKKLSKEYSINGPLLDSNIKIKIAGFKDYIKLNKKEVNINLKTRQKEQYLSPEIIFNSDYNETIDIWALACIIFELATGEALFDTKRDANFSQNENHILKFIEILGNMPNKLINRMKNPKMYLDMFKKLTKLKNIKRTSIKDLLITKYNFEKEEAENLNDFLSQMLEYYPEKRATAQEMLSHPWLNDNKKDMKFYNNNNDMNKKEDIYFYSNESNNEEFMADDEDNDKGEIYNEFENDEDSGDDNPDKVIIPNFNNSFAEYGQFIDLTTLDKANPQFDEILKNNDEFE